jgi:hypothetical protein
LEKPDSLLKLEFESFSDLAFDPCFLFVA